MLLFANADVASWMPFTQLGALGLLAMGFIWFFWKGAPLLMQKHESIVKSVTEDSKAVITKLTEDHKHAIDRLVLAFEKEAVECRSERLQTAKDAAVEREKDREARHATNDTLQKLVEKLEK